LFAFEIYRPLEVNNARKRDSEEAIYFHFFQKVKKN
jgi:hypothetical protein